MSRGIDAVVQRAQQRLDAVVRNTASSLLTALVQRTPVKTGRLRAGWVVQSTPAPVLPIGTDPGGGATVAAGRAALGRMKAGDSIHICNYLPYAGEVERGSSRQAPRGMLRITAAEAAAHIAAAAQKGTQS